MERITKESNNTDESAGLQIRRERGVHVTVKAQIVNVVATAALGQQLDLEELEKLEEILHDSEIYGGRVAYFKSPNMKGKVSIFPSGKMISIGTKSERTAEYELRYVQNVLAREGYVRPVPLEIKVHNIVASAYFETRISLEELAMKSNIIYEPEQFPAGIFRIREPAKATVLLFASGKAIITGLKRSDQIAPVVHKIADIITKTECEV